MAVPTLRDQRIVVIGGSSGIGFAVAEAALAEGARVIIGSSSAAKVEAAVAKLGQAASGAAVNVRDEASVQAFFAGVGAFDHLAYTAGDWDRPKTGSIAELNFAAAAEARCPALGRAPGGQARPAAPLGARLRDAHRRRSDPQALQGHAAVLGLRPPPSSIWPRASPSTWRPCG